MAFTSPCCADERIHLDDHVRSLLDCRLNASHLPIVYRPEHNIGFLGLEKKHPFDSKKFEKAAKFLLDDGFLPSAKCFIKAKIVPNSTLESYHTEEYLAHIKTIPGLEQVLEFPLSYGKLVAPYFMVNAILVKPMKHQVGSTILAGEMALLYGWSINLGGGMHHCSAGRGGGWCAFGDIQMCIRNLQEQNKVERVMIIDLDAHQGNGYENDVLDGLLGERENIFILDMFHHGIYPGDKRAQTAINVDISISGNDGVDVYISSLMMALEQAFREFPNPDFVIYNAGTDILKGDPLGHLHVTPEGVNFRDVMVFRACIERGIPVTYLTSGGYQQTNARIIADSIILMEKELGLLEVARRNFARNVLGMDVDVDGVVPGVGVVGGLHLSKGVGVVAEEMAEEEHENGEEEVVEVVVVVEEEEEEEEGESKGEGSEEVEGEGDE